MRSGASASTGRSSASPFWESSASGRPVSRPPQGPPRRGSRDLPAVHHERAVDRDVGKARAVNTWLLVRREILDPGHVHDDDVGGEADLDEATALEPRRLRRERRHLANGLLEADDFLVPNVLAEDPRRRGPAARV